MDGLPDTQRRDRAVVMARGASRRMGRPKGLLSLESGEISFVESIAARYRSLDIPVMVVALEETAAAYREKLAGMEDVLVIPGEAGGDTARTLAIAWRSGLADEDPWTHLWAHPVDLPLVETGSLLALGLESRRHPGRIVRPVYGESPGHPVICPVAVLELLEKKNRWQEFPFREFMATSLEQGLIENPLALAIDDPGVVQDFDSPADLESGPEPSTDRGSS